MCHTVRSGAAASMISVNFEFGQWMKLGSTSRLFRFRNLERKI